MEFSAKIRAFGQLSPVQQMEWASSRLPPWVALFLVVVLAWQLATLVWSLWPANTDDGAALGLPAQSTATNPNAAPRGAVNPGVIKRANLFGAYAAQNQPIADNQVVDAPETRLRLVLKGTVADADQSGAFAIIGEEGGGGGDKVYFVEDGVPGNATLHSVYPDKVLLNRAGKLETLTLKTLLDKAGTAQPTVSRRAIPAAANLRNLRQELVANPSQITDIIRPQPVFANGQQMGYRVYPGRDRKRFVELGLRPGDLVTEVNGTPLNDPAQGQQLFQQITQSDVINLTVQRSGQTQTLTLRMDE